MARQRLRDAEKRGRGDEKEQQRERGDREKDGARGGDAAGAGAGQFQELGCSHLLSGWWRGQSPRPPARGSLSLCLVAGARSRGPGAPPAVPRGSDGRAHSNLCARSPAAPGCPLAVHGGGGGDRPRERIGGNLSRPAPLLGLKSKPPVLCFLCLCLWHLVGDSLSSKGAAECGSPTPGGCPQPCLHHPCLPLLCKTQMDTRKASNTISKLNRQ